MKENAIKKIDELKNKIENNKITVDSINEHSSDKNSGSIKISYSENGNNDRTIGFNNEE